MRASGANRTSARGGDPAPRSRVSEAGSFVLSEAVVVSTLGGVLGVLVSYPFVEKGVGRFLEENMGGFFPFFRIDPTTAVAALILAAALGLLAAALPAYTASQLKVVDALRRAG